MQAQSYKRDKIDWPSFRSQVFARSPGATTIPDAYPAIQLAFNLLDDPHSRYLSKAGNQIRYSLLDCSSGIEPLPALPSNIGYIRVGTTSGVSSDEYSGNMQSAIRAADRDDTIGWIVDLRGNGGGSTYAMLAGVGPILGDGTAGSFVNPSGAKDEWGYRSEPGATGATLNGSVVVTPSTVYQLRQRNPRVAVLSDRANSSAGESTQIAFIGRANARSFGTASCGLSTGVASLPMRDGATLFLARSVMADRTGRLYGGSILPDETITNQAQLIARAVQWLQTGQ